MKRKRVKPILRQRAAELRKNETSTEIVLWKYLRKKRMCGLTFRRQHPIGDFIVDFYCPKIGLVIELDGLVHKTQQERDVERSRLLQAIGCTIIRFENHLVFEQLDLVLGNIRTVCLALSSKG
ncbi:MAG TPA: hypothetical protein DCE42_23825 [Myxococcales bacterium]|nr:hypothetical protein [Deltaproteobacteria bacterium]HAA57816.1 hypothetical protein [Myxococcales bacterium]